MAGLKSARIRGRMGGRPKGLSEKQNVSHALLKCCIIKTNLKPMKYQPNWVFLKQLCINI